MHTFTSLLVHLIFATHDRRPTISAEMRPELRAYLGGLARELKGKALAVNGVADHFHMLVSLSATLPVAEAMRMIKANSSRWIHQKWRKPGFGWQAGYAAFSVSQSNVPAVCEYIEDQEEHHRKVSFETELLSYLKKHGIEYDERYLWA